MKGYDCEGPVGKPQGSQRLPPMHSFLGPRQGLKQHTEANGTLHLYLIPNHTLVLGKQL